MKERLVGAAVLVAISVIVVPEFLSGPAQRDDAAPSAEKRGADGASLKTYEITLGALDEAGDAAGRPTEAGAGAASPAVDEGRAATPGREPPRDPAAPKPEGPRSAAASGTASAAGSWAVQAGSFANRSAAQKLAATLEQRGYPVFVTPFTSGGQTLHRVRIGPMKERTEAEATLRRLARDGIKGAVVANP